MTLSSRTVADWNTFVKETLVHYLDENSQPIGGDGVVVEVDETKFGKRRYTRGRFVEGKWVLGGIERGTKGRAFLVPVLDRQSETLTGLLKKWILPGTTVITNCWSAYDKLDVEDYWHLTVNYNFNFVDPTTAPYTNTIKNVWRHVKASLPTYNRQRDFSMYIADFLFDL